MSGICGVIHLDDRRADEDGLRSMITAGRHRATNGTVLSVGDGCAMAQLNSLQTREGGIEHQAVSARGGRYLIVADAQIHNRKELRVTLAPGLQVGPTDGLADGPPGDATLLLEAFLRWGDQCFDHLIGDYAFVIWDRRQRRLFAARDPMAMRPLYYHLDAARCIFASEVGQILAVTGVNKRIYRPMAAAWLMARAGDPTWTFFDGILQVPGAHSLEVTTHGGNLKRVWDIDPGMRIAYRSDDEYAQHFQEILLDATRCRLGGGHRTGMLLSGGLDSCAVAGAAGSILSEEARPDDASPPFTTYSYRYEGFPDCDERYISGPLAKHWGLEIEEISSDEWKRNGLLQTDWGIDSPVVGVYRPLQDAAMRRARSSGVRRILIAARGDNMMGGFLWDAAGLLASGALIETYREMSAYRRATGLSAWMAFRKTLLDAWKLGLASRFRPLASRHLRRHEQKLERRSAEGRLAEPWIPGHLLDEVPLKEIFPATPIVGFSMGALRARHSLIFDGFTELGNVQNERHLASHGVYYDDPWSDRRILEFVAAVPQHVLNRVGETKRVTRRALTGLVPAEVQANARKILPAAFGAHALRKKEGESLTAMTSNMRAARSGLVDERVLRTAIDAFLNGAEFSSSAWCAVTLEAWMRCHELEA